MGIRFGYFGLAVTGAVVLAVLVVTPTLQATPPSRNASPVRAGCEFRAGKVSPAGTRPRFVVTRKRKVSCRRAIAIARRCIESIGPAIPSGLRLQCQKSVRMRYRDWSVSEIDSMEYVTFRSRRGASFMAARS